MDYLDFGSSSDSDNDDGGEMLCAMDSDDEERQENKRLLQMFNLEDPPSKTQRNIQDFEAEMEAELDRRAFEIESQGGMEHQKSLSRSSSSTSLNKSPRASPVPGSSRPQKSCLKRTSSNSSDTTRPKSVKFDSNSTETTKASKDGNANDGEEKKAKEMYDELYFDSDESDGEDETKKKKKHDKRRFMTNDELFYDPSSDAKDQEWIDGQRRKSYGESNYATTSASSSTKAGDAAPKNQNESDVQNEDNTEEKPSPNLPSTDAVLNCPACFTTVCHDCQRHELYVGQYRAMFVMNCLINRQEILSVPEKAPKKFRKRRKGTNNVPEFTPNSSSDVFHPVMCKICKTQVAMYDSDEVYHFFNVLASQP